jgi:hypothetical protein
VVAVIPKGPLTLAQRVDVLFGNKPDEVIPAAPAITAPATTAPVPAPVAKPASAVVAPVAPVVEAAPAAPSADAKAAEKGKDLDRKINQLFK